MKIKKRYYVACILMCVAALLLGIATFYVEMGLSRYAKLNSVTSKTWMATSGSDLETRLNTDLSYQRYMILLMKITLITSELR